LIFSAMALAAAAAAAQPAEAPQPARPAPPTAVAAPHSDEALFASCTALVKREPERAVTAANEWRIRGGGVLARQCLGLAYVALERWAPAAVVFEQAAREAETERRPQHGDLWVQAGNSWLAANEGAKARDAFDAALATSLLAPEMRGEVHLDRARALVALGDLGGARRDIDKGLALVPADPFAWYLSAALALRQGDLGRAQRDVAKAVEGAPDDAAVLLLAGNIAGASGEEEAARGFYARSARAAPGSEAARAAEAALGAEASAGNAAAASGDAEAPR
jgi:tetratricopeptide (TPR) repeat protein